MSPFRDAPTVAPACRLRRGSAGEPDAARSVPEGSRGRSWRDRAGDVPAPRRVLELVDPRGAGAIVAGRYRLVERLGRGGMGEVWRAQHVTLHTEVAVKFPSLVARGRAATMMFERFRFEAQIAARLGLATPHVTAVHDAGSDPDGPYLVMEYVPGRTLEQEIDDRVILPLPRVAEIVAQVAEALATAHGLGVIHRDLKPSNLLLSARPDGALLVKVADFGIAKALRLDLGADLPGDTTGGFMIGSPPYMSPEQLAGGAASALCDLWSLAVIAYEAVTGRLPFAGRSFAELAVSQARGRFDPPSVVRPGVPASVDGWFRRALARDEGRRFRAAREMAAALDEVVGQERAGPKKVGWGARLRLLAGLPLG